MKYVRIVNGWIDTDTIVKAANRESAHLQLLDSDVVGTSDSFDIINVDDIIEAARVLSKGRNILPKWKCPSCGGETGIDRKDNMVVCKDCGKPIGIACNIDESA